MSATRCWWWLVLGVLASAAYQPVRQQTVPATIVFEGAGALSALVMLVGIRRNRPDQPLVWYLLLAGTVLSVLGDAIYDYLSNYAHTDAFPSIADAFYVASYPATAAGLWVLVRSRRGGRDQAGLLDAAVVSTALGLAVWTFLIRPTAAQYDTGEFAQFVALAYPVGDVLTIALTARLLTSPQRRSPAFILLVAGLIARLPADAAFNLASAMGKSIDYLDWMWLICYVCTAAAALHPSMRRLTEPIPVPPIGLSLSRLTVLAAMSLFAPGVLALEGLIEPHNIDWVAVTVGSATLFLLVLARMRGLLARLQEQTRLLDSLAHVDALTQLPNRRSWDDALNSHVTDCARTEIALVVGLIDLDHFKRFNDTYGHQDGDHLLSEAAAAWRAALRDEDLIARYGGEEFGLIMTGQSLPDVIAAVDRLRAVTPRGQTFSAGLVAWDGVASPAELVHLADRALYEAKDAGRDRVVAHGPHSARAAGPER